MCYIISIINVQYIVIFIQSFWTVNLSDCSYKRTVLKASFSNMYHMPRIMRIKVNAFFLSLAFEDDKEIDDKKKKTVTTKTREKEMELARWSRQPRRNGSVSRFSRFSEVKRKLHYREAFWAWESREPCAKGSFPRRYPLHLRCLLVCFYTYMRVKPREVLKNKFIIFLLFFLFAFFFFFHWWAISYYITNLLCMSIEICRTIYGTFNWNVD